MVSGPALHQMLKSFLKLVKADTMRGLTKLWMPIGKKVVVIGGGLHGCEIAEFLIKRGRKVTIVDTADAIGIGTIDFRLPRLLSWFNEKGVRMIPGVRDMEITDKGLNILTKEGTRETLAADSVVLAQPLAPNDALFKELEGKAPEVYNIGDSKEPRLIVYAVAQGWQVGNRI